jgi:hypothetical protein
MERTNKIFVFAAALLAAQTLLAAGSQTALALDLARKNTAISLTWTEYCDNAVLAAVLRGGEEFPVAGWDVALVLGGTTSGCVVEGIAAGYNTVLFDIPASSIPTNGRYTVQINAMKDRRSEEWGRGSLRVNVNNGVSYMPTCWTGYQKVARLAASMLTMEFITNEVFTAVLTNVSSLATVEPLTRPCVVVTKSKVAEIEAPVGFVCAETNGTQYILRSFAVPAAHFTFTANGEEELSTFALNGETFLPEKLADGKWWYRSTSNPTRKLSIRLTYVSDSVYRKMLYGEEE